MHVWKGSKGKIPSETKGKKRRDGDVYMHLSSTWWDVHTSSHPLMNNKCSHQPKLTSCYYVRWWICLKAIWPCLKRHHFAVSLILTYKGAKSQPGTSSRVARTVLSESCRSNRYLVITFLSDWFAFFQMPYFVYSNLTEDVLIISQMSLRQSLLFVFN